jgi:hypothetical protein
MTIYIEKYDLVFYHIPKTGGTSIKKWLKKNVRSEITFIAPNSIKINNDILTPHMLPKQFIDISHKPNNSLCVVRNPWSRVVSSYKFFKKRQKEKSENSYDLKDIIWEDTYGYNLENLSEISFKDFLKLCELNNDFLLIDKNQIKYVNPKNHNNLIMLKFENFKDEFTIVQDLFKCYEPLPHSHKSSIETPYQEYYDSQTIDIVYKKYKDDIEYFKYRFE